MISGGYFDRLLVVTAALLTAMEKAEIEHAICSGHLGSRLTEAEARYFAGIISGGSDDVSDHGASGGARAKGRGVEGEAAALVRSQRGGSSGDDGALSAHLLRSHEHAVATATWSGKGSG